MKRIESTGAVDGRDTELGAALRAAVAAWIPDGSGELGAFARDLADHAVAAGSAAGVGKVRFGPQASTAHPASGERGPGVDRAGGPALRPLAPALRAAVLVVAFGGALLLALPPVIARGRAIGAGLELARGILPERSGWVLEALDGPFGPGLAAGAGSAVDEFVAGLGSVDPPGTESGW